uniref:Tetraspanin n=1 Tax=Romanomermis culicivorax TaxID=13658 RepID=A0A915HJF4_ROMCU
MNLFDCTAYGKFGRFSRYSFYFSNVLSLIICSSAISYAIWVVHCRRIFAALFQPTLYVACAFITIVVGLTSIVASLGAFYAASKELRCLMHSYAVTNIVLFIMMIIVGIMGYVFQWQLAEHAIDTQLWSNLQHFYGQPGHEDMTKAWDYMQQEFHCCGVDDVQKNFVIWRTSKWHMDYRGTPKKLVPSSCCRRSPNGSFVDESACQFTDMKTPNLSAIFVKVCTGCAAIFQNYIPRFFQ